MEREDMVSGQKPGLGQTAWKTILEDESKFMDFTRSSMWYGKEQVFVDCR